MTHREKYQQLSKRIPNTGEGYSIQAKLNLSWKKYNMGIIEDDELERVVNDVELWLSENEWPTVEQLQAEITRLRDALGKAFGHLGNKAPDKAFNLISKALNNKQ